MLNKPNCIPHGTLPRLMLLDFCQKYGERRAAIIHPGRQPVIYQNLAQALDVLRAEAGS